MYVIYFMAKENILQLPRSWLLTWKQLQSFKRPSLPDLDFDPLFFFAGDSKCFKSLHLEVFRSKNETKLSIKGKSNLGT